MASETRKRLGNAGDSGRRTRMRGDGGRSLASDDEVEEFFAILRRIHVATSCLGNGSGDGVKATDKGGGWRPAFAWEDFERASGVRSDGGGGVVRRKEKREGEGEGEERKTKEGEEERTEENAVLLSLDLNADPEPERDAHFSP
ncbi:NIM1-interacting [Asimina triloba]